MKQLLLLFVLSISSLAFAQIPQGISYQAIALNGSNAPVASSNVNVRISILDTSATGTVLYTETHLKTTNAQGLFNLTIGQGTVVSGTFASIKWETNSKFLKVEMDATGGTTFATVGTTQLLTVPYAMAAGSLSGSSANDSIEENKYTNFAFYDSSADATYAFNQNTGTWVAQAGGDYTAGTIVPSNGNFAFYDSSADRTYAFSKKTNTWVAQTGGDYTIGTIMESEGNFAFYDSSADKTYAFNQSTGTWIAQNGGDYTDGTIIPSSGNFAFYDSSADATYAFNKKTGTWVAQAGGDYTAGTIVGASGNFAFYDSSADKTYVFNKNTNTWIAQNGGDYTNGTIIISSSN